MTPGERWRPDLTPQQVAVWTGDDSGDVLEQDDIMLDGCLYNPGSLDFGERHLLSRRKELIRSVVLNAAETGPRTLRG